MILVDTSVWIDHLRRTETGLVRSLHEKRVLTHLMVIGELACGNLPNRAETLHSLGTLPRIDKLDHEEVLSFIDSRGFVGRGIGYIDAHLIGSVLKCGRTLLWTRDRRLGKVAEDLGVAYSKTPRRSA